MIANSLGSRYTLETVLIALSELIKHYGRYVFDFVGISYSNEKVYRHLQALLQAYVPGTAFLFYKGRDAIEFTLRAHLIAEGDAVLTQAFTCHAIEEAILRSGAEPEFVDLAPQAFNPGVDEYEVAYKAALKRKKQPKALIVQHTLGYGADIKEITAWAKKKQLLVIEDIAQAVGAETAAKTFVGTDGDVTIFSFGRDKIIDAVSGGAAVFKQLPDHPLPSIGTVPRMVVTRDLLYPLVTWLIRKTYSIGLGKAIHFLAKKVELITSPIASPTSAPTHLPASHAVLAVAAFEKLGQTIRHQQALAQLYREQLQDVLVNQFEHDPKLASYIRYSCLVPNPDTIIKLMAQFGIHIADRWYRQAVDCGSLQVTSLYVTGTCPRAEHLAQHIINLPTHQAINEFQVVTVCDVLQEALEETQ